MISHGDKSGTPMSNISLLSCLMLLNTLIVKDVGSYAYEAMGHPII